MAFGMLHVMDATDVLSKNVQALLDQRGWSIKRAAIEAKKHNLAVSNGTLGRIVKGQTATKVSYLDDLAKLFEVQVWHLFVPALDPKNEPVLATVSDSQKALWERLAQTREAIDGLLQSDGNTRPGSL